MTKNRVSRRELLKWGLYAGGSTMLLKGCTFPEEEPGRRSWRDDDDDGSGDSSTSFEAALPIPPVLQPVSTDDTTDYYEITMQAGSVQLRSGPATAIWGYSGIWPGPTIRARSGRRVVVQQYNELPEETVVHLHGANTPPSSDGHPVDAIQPGSSRQYVYPNAMPQAPLWYHDHAMDVTGAHVYKGLAGMYLLTDDLEESLGLPSGDKHVPLVLQDRTLDADNQLVYSLDSETIREGFLGELMCVNGAITPHFEVANVKYRFTILNGSNARTYRLRLSDGSTFKVIGTDGGFLPEPVDVSSLEIASAERFDIVIDFSRYALGTSIVLENTDSHHSPDLPEVMRFDVTRDETDSSEVPSTLRPITYFSESDASVCRQFRLSHDYDEGWVINGKRWDEHRIDAKPLIDSVEIWEFENQSGHMHPMHIHLVQFQILDIDGKTPPAELRGWKDTVRVPSWSNARVIARYADHTGVYVYHCHKLEHEDRYMMAQFEVVGTESESDGSACDSDDGGW